MFTAAQLALAEKILADARARHLRLATAESCTGGLVAGCLTAIAGSSDVFDRGFVTYSNEAKTEMLGVRPDLIAAHGAVSVDVAEAMAKGAITHSAADIAVSITGIAGPGGGSPQKPVGTVCFGIASPDHIQTERKLFQDAGRTGIRVAALDEALALLLLAVRSQTTSASDGE